MAAGGPSEAHNKIHSIAWKSDSIAARTALGSRFPSPAAVEYDAGNFPSASRVPFTHTRSAVLGWGSLFRSRQRISLLRSDQENLLRLPTVSPISTTTTYFACIIWPATGAPSQDLPVAGKRRYPFLTAFIVYGIPGPLSHARQITHRGL